MIGLFRCVREIRGEPVLTERSEIKRRTMERRKKEYLAQKAA
jgi:hypothetical protein